TVFEFHPVEEGSQSAMGAGGRYDGLMEELGGQPTPGVGFGSGIERLIINLKRQKLGPVPPSPPDAFVVVATEDAPGVAIKLARELRRKGRLVIMGGGRSLRAQMRQANALGARYALILGQEELAAGTVTLRDLAGQAQEVVPMAGVAARLGNESRN